MFIVLFLGDSDQLLVVLNTVSYLVNYVVTQLPNHRCLFCVTKSYCSQGNEWILFVLRSLGICSQFLDILQYLNYLIWNDPKTKCKLLFKKRKHWWEWQRNTIANGTSFCALFRMMGDAHHHHHHHDAFGFHLYDFIGIIRTPVKLVRVHLVCVFVFVSTSLWRDAQRKFGNKRIKT